MDFILRIVGSSKGPKQDSSALSLFQINGLERVRVWWGGGQRKDLSRGLLPPTKDAGVLN